MRSRLSSATALVSCSLFIGLFFAVPDIVGWRFIDHGQTPIRGYMGDQTHYLTRIHRLQVEGRVGDSVFTWEHKDNPTQFVLFDSLMSNMPGLKSIPALWWYAILKSAAAVAAFLALYFLIRSGRVEHRLAFPAALAATFFYGPYALQGPGITSWFLILFLAGLVTMVFVVARNDIGYLGLAVSILFLVASATHPVLLVEAVGVGGFWWFFQCLRRRTARVWIFTAVWLFAALVCLNAFYGSFLQVIGDAGSALSESIERNAALRTRVPVFPLLALKFLILSLAAWLGYHREGHVAPTQLADRWLVPGFLALTAFAAEISNTVTSFSYFGDHFRHIEDFIVIPLAAMMLFDPAPSAHGSSKTERGLGALFLIAAGIFAASLTIGRPIRSWLVLGRWIPLLAGYALIGWRLVGGHLGSLLTFYSRQRLRLVALSVLYAGLLLWRLYAHAAPEHEATQQYRPLFTALSEMPRGVIMMPLPLTELVALYTPQRVYWASINESYAGSYEELSARWIDQALVFYKDPRFLAEEYGGGGFSVFGAANEWCDKLSEKAFYAVLRRLGLTHATLCNTAVRDRLWPGLLQKRLLLREAIARGEDWQPAYRLDWLVVEKDSDAVLPELLNKYFVKYTEVGRFELYRYWKPGRQFLVPDDSAKRPLLHSLFSSPESQTLYPLTTERSPLH